ncbi:hypothetical protein Taro_049528 [Colocasia esculenta]|uniref:Uncharacterized protein n=1 Tax=Colocasia esculenta TaxID=4460 RepID=A0A843XB27_COLES|nr:hypothetical protein [Colocasia esculenta]
MASMFSMFFMRLETEFVTPGVPASVRCRGMIGWVTRWCRGVGVHHDSHLCRDVRATAPVSRSGCRCGCVPRVRIAGVKATCQVSRSPEAPARATRGLAPVGLSEAVEGSLRRSGAMERPGARAERRRVRGARRRRPTNARAPSWGGFSVLSFPHAPLPVCACVVAWGDHGWPPCSVWGSACDRDRVAVTIPVWRRRSTCRLRVATGWPSRSPLPFSSGFCSKGGTLAVAFGVATGQSSHSTFWGSDDALVAFSPSCRLAAGQWPRLRSGLLTLNATGRYVAFRRRPPGRRDLVATGWLSPSCSEGDTLVVAIRLFWLLFCLAVFRLLMLCRVCRRWPTAPPGFPEGVPCVPVPAGLVLVTSQLCRFCGDCPACSLFARCSALEGLSHLEVVSVSWDPHALHFIKIAVASKRSHQ